MGATGHEQGLRHINIAADLGSIFHASVQSTFIRDRLECFYPETPGFLEKTVGQRAAGPAHLQARAVQVDQVQVPVRLELERRRDLLGRVACASAYVRPSRVPVHIRACCRHEGKLSIANSCQATFTTTSK